MQEEANPTESKEEQLHRVRHSLAHILAQAVLQIRPKAKLGFGPAIDTGFYYDFDFGDEPVGEGDLKNIEKRMIKIINKKQEFQVAEKTLEEMVGLLEETDQSYKIEHARELVEKGAAEGGKLGIYTNGPFFDMCEGPHVESTGDILPKCFKLDKIAGSYWKGDEKRPMLTRIYGLAFEDKEQVDDYIARRKLAMERDHRKLGAELDLFVLDEEVGVGLPLWLPNGTVIRDELEKWSCDEEFKAGYQRVSTPTITKSELYKRSGHVPYYQEDMFPPMVVDEKDEYYLRPMNCPHHHKIYDSRPRSYRDLPFRIAEYGNTYRYEKHGALTGLLRVRAMCMNDAHIYCEPDQVRSEFKAVIEMYNRYYEHLRLGRFRVRLSLHDKDSGKYVDNEEEWLRSEQIVRETLIENGVDFTEEVGEAAFYGPKMDIQIKNLLGREETVSTCQLDFVMADRFDLNYIDRDNENKRPYIIHRAPLSTHERLVAFLIEFYGGAFPTWMAPMQVRLIPVGEHAMEYTKEVEQTLRNRMVRVEVDDSKESFNKKIRNGVTRKIPNLWIIGNEESENRSITWRRYCAKEQLKMPMEKAVDAIEVLRNDRMMDNFDDIEIPTT